MSDAGSIHVGRFTFDESYECPDPEGVRFLFPLSRSLSTEEFEALRREVESFQIMRRDKFEVRKDEVIYECTPGDALLVKAGIERALRDVVAALERQKAEEAKKVKERSDARQRLLDAARDAVEKQE